MWQLKRKYPRRFSRTNIIAILIGMTLSPLSGQGWEVLDPGTTAHLMDITFVNDSTGWIVGWEGTILHTTDAGDTWTPQTSNTNLDLYGVHFRDFLRGWAVGRNGVVIGTVDGGNTWVEQFQATEGILYDVAFQDEQYGWAVGDVTGETSSGTLVRTGDSGQSWSIAQGPVECRRVEFLDSQTGWMVGTYSKAYCTVNGGGYWREFSLCQMDSCWDYYPFLHEVYFSDPAEGWIAGDWGTVFHTTDSGNTWIDVSLDIAITPIALHFFDEQHGVLFGHHSGGLVFPPIPIMMSTVDGGQTWKEWKCPLGDYCGWIAGYNEGAFTANYGYAVGWYGTLIRVSLETLAVEEPPVIPAAFQLHQNHPNPFNPATTIRYELPRAAQVALIIYDLMGREVATLVEGYSQPGMHEVIWNAGDHPSGIYLARLATSGYSKTIKLVLLK